MITRRVLLKSTAAVAALTVLAPASVESDGPIRVVATFSILGDMVSRIGGTLYPGALSGPEDPAPTYLDMMRHNARTLAQALAP